MTELGTDEVHQPPAGCACCQAPLHENQFVTLHRRSDVSICFHCLSWLNRQRGRKRLDLIRLALPDWLPIRKPHERQDR